MAYSDLASSITEGQAVGEELERKVVERVLGGLDDASNDVQSMAVKCLSALYANLSTPRVAEIGAKLTSLLRSEDRSKMSDVYSMGLQALIRGAPVAAGESIWASVYPGVRDGLRTDSSVSGVILEKCLEVMAELMTCLGARNSAAHEPALDTLLSMLSQTSVRPAVRKRVTHSLCCLASVLSDPLLDRLVDKAIAGTKSKDPRSHVQLIGALSKTVGHRMGPVLGKLVPVFVSFCGSADDDIDDSEARSEKDEVRDASICALESFVGKCPIDVLPFMESILAVATEFAKYDPNWCADDDQGMDMDVDDDDEQEEQDPEDEDEEDDSWKVRRASVRLLGAVVSVHGRLLGSMFAPIADALFSRVGDRQEIVKIEAAQTSASLIDAVAKSPEPTRSAAVQALSLRSPQLVRLCCRELEGGRRTATTAKNTSAVLSVLRALVSALGSAGMGQLLDTPLVLASRLVSDKSGVMRCEALELLLTAIQEGGTDDNLHRNLPVIVPAVVTAAAGDGGRGIALALRCIEKLATSIPLATLDWASLTQTALTRLGSSDSDSESREAVLSAAAALASIGALSPSQSSAVVDMLMARMEDDTIRVAAIRSLSVVSASTDLSAVSERLTASLTQLLRQQSRILKETVLTCLLTIFSNASMSVSDSQLKETSKALSGLVSDADPLLAQVAVQVAIIMVQRFPSSIFPVCADMYQKTLPLVASSHDLSKESFVELIKALILARAVLFNDAIDSLRGQATTNSSKTSIAALARAMCEICVDDATRLDLANRCVQELNIPNDMSAMRRLELHCIGEVGSRVDIAAVPLVQQVIFSAFESSTEDNWSAASFALGRAAVGSPDHFLRVILKFTESPHFQHQLLAAVRELISKLPANATNEKEQILPALLRKCSDPDKAVRTSVAECLGLLAALDPVPIITVISGVLRNNDDKNALSTVASALRFLLAKTNSRLPLQDVSSIMLQLLADHDLTVKEEALRMLTSCFHKNLDIALPSLKTSIVPLLMHTLQEKMVVEVDLGPFKQKNDLCLAHRRLALECVHILLDVAPQEVDIAAILDSLVELLRDEESVRMVAHKILARLCEMSPSDIVSKLDFLIDPLLRTIPAKAPDNKKGPELERALEVIRSAIRTVYLVNAVPGAKSHSKWSAFVTTVRAAPLVIELSLSA